MAPSSSFNDLTWDTVRGNLQRKARAQSAAAFAAGVKLAEIELRKSGLMDFDAEDFIRRFPYESIQSVTFVYQEKVRQVLVDAFRSGKGTDEIARELRGILDSGEARISTIARTEANRAANSGRFTAWTKSGVVQKKMAVATADDRTRDTHLEADGEIVDLNDTFTQGAAAGLLVPPWEPNCRCTVTPITRLREAIGPSAAVEEHQQAIEDEMDRRADLVRLVHPWARVEAEYVRALRSEWGAVRRTFADALANEPGRGHVSTVLM